MLHLSICQVILSWQPSLRYPSWHRVVVFHSLGLARIRLLQKLSSQRQSISFSMFISLWNLDYSSLQFSYYDKLQFLSHDTYQISIVGPEICLSCIFEPSLNFLASLQPHLGIFWAASQTKTECFCEL